MTTQRQTITRVGWVFVALAALTLPWAVYLAYSLPQRSVAHHYDIAWAGFDVGLVLVLALCALAAFKAHRSLPLATTAAATMLLVDAWFDIVTSVGTERLIAIAMAALVELPLAGLCLWLSLNVQQVVGELDRRRARRQERRTMRAEQRRPRDGGSSAA